jgi:hypothetical protein
MYDTLCSVCVCPEPVIKRCPGVNIVTNIPERTELSQQLTAGFSFQVQSIESNVNNAKIQSILFPVTLWTGVGDTREFGIWNSDTEELLYQDTIDKTVIEGDYYVKILTTPFELNKDILYVFGSVIKVGDYAGDNNFEVTYTNPGIFINVFERLSNINLNVLTFPSFKKQENKIYFSMFKYSLTIGCTI